MLPKKLEGYQEGYEKFKLQLEMGIPRACCNSDDGSTSGSGVEEFQDRPAAVTRNFKVNHRRLGMRKRNK